jgi:uncharacterized protein YcfJ
MKVLKSTIAIAILVFASTATAGQFNKGHKKDFEGSRQDLFEYARVLEVQPIYREVRVSRPLRECRDVPVYHTHRQGQESAGAMLAGGLIGGIIGHQFGDGRVNRVATVVGTLVGAKIGQDVGNGSAGSEHETLVGYEEHCQIRQQLSYEEVVDGYDVTYRYRGRDYHVEMPYDPGKRIKMRIQFTPVI